MGNHMGNHMGNQIVKSLIRNSNWKYDFGEIRADYSLGYARRALGWSFGGILGQVIQKINMNLGKYFHAPSRLDFMKLATLLIDVKFDFKSISYIESNI